MTADDQPKIVLSDEELTIVIMEQDLVEPMGLTHHHNLDAALRRLMRATERAALAAERARVSVGSGPAPRPVDSVNRHRHINEIRKDCRQEPCWFDVDPHAQQCERHQRSDASPSVPGDGEFDTLVRAMSYMCDEKSRFGGLMREAMTAITSLRRTLAERDEQLAFVKDANLKRRSEILAKMIAIARLGHTTDPYDGSADWFMFGAEADVRIRCSDLESQLAEKERKLAAHRECINWWRDRYTSLEAQLATAREALNTAPMPVRESIYKGEEWDERYVDWWDATAASRTPAKDTDS